MNTPRDCPHCLARYGHETRVELRDGRWFDHGTQRAHTCRDPRTGKP